MRKQAGSIIGMLTPCHFFPFTDGMNHQEQPICVRGMVKPFADGICPQKSGSLAGSGAGAGLFYAADKPAQISKFPPQNQPYFSKIAITSSGIQYGFDLSRTAGRIQECH